MAAPAAMLGYSQVPFTLDTTFRTELTQRNMNSILIREDSKVIASGIMRFPGDMSDRAGALFQEDGSRDLSFANVAPMGGKITPWADRMYVGNGQGMRRLWLDGTLDASFNMVSAPYFSPIQGGDHHVYPDGRVLFSGTHQLSDAAHGFVGNYNLVWFSNQGYLDTTRVHKQGNGPIYRFGQYLDGGFLCSSNASVYEGQPVDKIFRVDSLGVLDTAFHSHVYLGRAYAFLPLPDGRMYAAGTFWRTDSPPESLWLVRFMPDGSDSS